MSDFISWTYDPAINAERSTIILDLVRFIRQGLKDLDEVGMALEWQVKAVLRDKMDSPLAKPMQRRHYQPAGDTLDLVVGAVTASRRRPAGDGPLGAFPAGRITDDLQERLGALWHPTVGQAPTVTDAFRVACSNLARATSRVVVLHALRDLLNLRVLEGAQRIHAHLWQTHTHFQRDVLLLGALVGGEALKEAVRTVGPQVCCSTGPTNFAVMHLLEVDGASPGHWMAATEDSLQASIKAAYAAV